ncbi:MAG: WD repeat-containing protein 36 [Marteilia pararefringens]
MFKEIKDLGIVSNYGLGVSAAQRCGALFCRKKMNQNLLVLVNGKRKVDCFTIDGLGYTSTSDEVSFDIYNVLTGSNLIALVGKYEIAVLKRLRKVKYSMIISHDQSLEIIDSIFIGKFIFLLISDGTLKIIDSDSQQIMKESKIDSDRLFLQMCHPPTYVNKILLLSQERDLVLFDFERWEIIYTYQYPELENHDKLYYTPKLDMIVTSSPKSKSINFIDIKKDQLLFSIDHECSDLINDIKFFDNQWPIAIVVSHKSLYFYNIETQKLVFELIDCHKSSINHLEIIPTRGEFLTTSNDNSIKVWTFMDNEENLTTEPRLLHSRSGINGQINSLRFYDDFSNYLVAGGSSAQLIMLSTRHESLNRYFGKASADISSKKNNKKKPLPPILEIASCNARSDDYDSMITLHENKKKLGSWNVGSNCFSKYSFALKDSEQNVFPTSILMSICGLFVYVGYSNGNLLCFSAETGNYKSKFTRNSQGERAHSSEIISVVSDLCSRSIFSASIDKTICFWDSYNYKFLGKLTMNSRINKMIYNSENKLLACSMHDNTVIIVDSMSKNIVRIFKHHKMTINDLAFTADLKYLLVASMDSTITIWDIISGLISSKIECSTPAISIAASPNGEFLATANINSSGVKLYYNCDLFNSMPSSSFLGEFADIDNSHKRSQESLQYSNLPPIHYKNLLNVDQIIEHNRPKSKVSKSKKIPFFLLAELESTTIDKVTENSDQLGAAKNNFVLENPSEKIASILNSNSPIRVKKVNCFALLSKYGPVSLDKIFKTLAFLFNETQGSAYVDAFETFIDILLDDVNEKRNFDLVIVYAYLFLKHFAEIIMEKENEKLFEKFDSLMQQITPFSNDLSTLFDETLSILTFLRSNKILL